MRKANFPLGECSSKCQSNVHAEEIIRIICRSGDVESLIYLATAGICCNPGKVTDKHGRSGLHLAASVGKPLVAEWLLRFKGASINARDGESGYSPLHRAAFYGQIHVAKMLVSQCNASLSILDNDGLTALDHFSLDRQAFRMIYGHYFSPKLAPPSKTFDCDAYVWGANTNYNLGLGHEQAKPLPDINELLRKENCQQVVLSKLHSAFVTSKGTVYTCGEGRGGRLGHGNHTFQLLPKPIVSLSEHKVIMASLGIEHSLFLTSKGLVFACGSNECKQIGIKTDDSEVTAPVLLNGSKAKLPQDIVGIAASRFHSLFWTKTELYSWGLNAGQLGHLNSERLIESPRIVTQLRGYDIQEVGSSDGAVVILLKNGDLMALSDYKANRVASRLNNVAKIAVVGGHLDAKAISKYCKTVFEKGGPGLKIFILSKIGKIHVWQQKNPMVVVQCLFNLTRELLITDMVAHKHGLLLISKEGSAYEGVHYSKANGSTSALATATPTKDNGGPLLKFIDRNQCDTIKVKRVPLVHKGFKAAADPKGNNFCVLQITPNYGLNDVAHVGKRTLQKDMRELFEDDSLKDMEIQCGSRAFRCHNYIIAAAGGQKLLAKIDEGDSADSAAPELMLQILQYAYFQSCDMMKEGPLSFKVTKPTSSNVQQQNGFSPEQLKESAHNVYKGKKNKKNSQHYTDDSSNVLSSLQELAKSFGMYDMARQLDLYSYNPSSNCVKLKPNFPTKESNNRAWSRTKFLDLADVVLVSSDEVKYKAHKCMLSARLDYFRSMFSMGWIESTKEEMTTVNLPLTSSLCQVLLDFIYTDFDRVASEDPEFLCNVLVMADQLLMPRLIQVCEHQLSFLLTLKNVGEILQLAHDLHSEQLKRVCMDFVCHNVGALIESRGLDVVDMEALKDVSLHYQSINKSLCNRVITPSPCQPSTEEIESHVASVELTPSDLFELEEDSGSTMHENSNTSNTSSSSSKKKRARRISTESTGSSGCENDLLNQSKEEVFSAAGDDSIVDDFEMHLSLKENRNCDNSPFILIGKKEKLMIGDVAGEEQDVIQSFFNDPKKFSTPPSKIDASAKKFSKLSQKERKKQLQNAVVMSELGIPDDLEKPKWNGWGLKVDKSDSLASIMKDEVQSTASPVATAAVVKSGFPKRTRKQSWKSLSFDDTEASLLAVSPPPASSQNPWKIMPQPAKVESRSLHEILREESVQTFNLTRAKAKPFHVTQTEEKAILDLKKFYNITNVFDEYITIERASGNVVMATPIWTKRK